MLSKCLFIIHFSFWIDWLDFMNQSQPESSMAQQKPKLSYEAAEKEKEQRELDDQFMKNPRIIVYYSVDLDFVETERMFWTK